MRNIIYGNTGKVHRVYRWMDWYDRYHYGLTLCGLPMSDSNRFGFKPDHPTTKPVTCKTCLRIMEAQGER